MVVSHSRCVWDTFSSFFLLRQQGKPCVCDEWKLKGRSALATPYRYFFRYENVSPLWRVQTLSPSSHLWPQTSVPPLCSFTLKNISDQKWAGCGSPWGSLQATPTAVSGKIMKSSWTPCPETKAMHQMFSVTLGPLKSHSSLVIRSCNICKYNPFRQLVLWSPF